MNLFAFFRKRRNYRIVNPKGEYYGTLRGKHNQWNHHYDFAYRYTKKEAEEMCEIFKDMKPEKIIQ